jgi:ATP-dependent exoDNAse (exonuclease V) beta subunit
VGVVGARLNGRRGKSTEPTAYDFLQRMERERSRNEDARVLYVAATRAVRRLYLVGVATLDDEGAPAAPAANTPLARLWPAIEADFRGGCSETAASVGTDLDLKDFVPKLQRLREPAVVTEWIAPPLPVTTLASPDDAGDALAAAVGTLVHAVLEQVAADPAAWPADGVAARQPGFERWLASRGWPPAGAREGALRAGRMLATALGSADGQWVLKSRPDEGSELALAKAGAGGTVAIRVVDRSFVEAGVRWIIDYKTADLGVGSDAARLAAHAERYRAQLEAYAGLFAGTGQPLRLAVFYVAHGILASLEYNSISE